MDTLAYVQNTQPKAWAKYQQLYPNWAEEAFLSEANGKPTGSQRGIQRGHTLFQ